ncbi:hypothetical protein ACNAW0_04220 [Micromonospora sp. SL1-18]
MRIGPVGKEKHAIRLDDTTYIEVSDIASDFDERFFARLGTQRQMVAAAL